MDRPMVMTAEQLAEAYDISVKSITSNFPRTQAAIEKKCGDRIEKEGRGKNARYIVKDFSRIDQTRAVTIYESQEMNKLPMKEAVGLMDINFFTFVSIVGSPQRTFRGSYYDLLHYMEIDAQPQDIETIKRILHELADDGLILFMEDNSVPDDPYFLAAVRHKAEKEMSLDINMLLRLQEIAKQENRKSWFPLMKVYIAVALLQQPCTIKKLSDITGLSDYKVRDCLVALEKNNILIKEVERVTDPLEGVSYCIGTRVTLNAF